MEQKRNKNKKRNVVFLTDQVSGIKVRGLILVLWLADCTFSQKAWQSGVNVQSFLKLFL